MNIEKLTLKEKASLLSGRGNWFFRGLPKHGLQEIIVADGPHGLRKKVEPGAQSEYKDSIPATCFPTACAIASSWDRALIGTVGDAIAKEASAGQVSIVLGPGANIKRSPLCGRNFEYFSEDPFLSGELAAAMINSIQTHKIGCSLKHFAVNNQEKLRMTIDAVVDERTLHEIYLAGFENAVKQSKPWTVMCAYNRVNGEYASENHYLLTRKLRDEWGFDGIVISDWGACNNRVEGLKAGLEIEMPYSGKHNPESVVQAVESGQLPEAILDTAVERIYDVMSRTAPDPSVQIDMEEHHLIAREAAADSIVLLKNESGVLPLKPGDRIAVIGEFAVNPRYQGAGSSRINPTSIDNFLEQIRADFPGAPFAAGFSLDRNNKNEKHLAAEAATLADAADKIIILAGLPDDYESEGFDRADMKLPAEQDRLIQMLCDTGKPVIVCLSNGSPVEMPWNNDASAVVECYLGGQAGAGALADIVTGRVNPSGKLAESFPVKLEDNPSFKWFPGGPLRVEYREGIYVGYRYYDTAGVPVLYPFGHGLSYTGFEYSGIKISRNGWEIEVSLNVKNTGSRRGKEVVQLYITPPEDDGKNKGSLHRPAKELKGFVKTEIAAGEEAAVSIKLGFRSFACYDPQQKLWVAEPGIYTIHAGASSADIRQSAEIRIESGKKNNTPLLSSEKAADESDYIKLRTNSEIIHVISDKSFEGELGRKPPVNLLPETYGRTTTLSDFQQTFTGKILMRIAMRAAREQSKGIENSAGMFEAMAKEMPLRAMPQFNPEMVNIEMVDALLLTGNGHFLQGLFALLRAVKKLKTDLKEEL